MEVYQAVRSEVGDDFPIGVKLNSADFLRGGFEADDSLQVIEMLDKAGVDLLEISGGTYEKFVAFRHQDLSLFTGLPRESSRRRESHFLEFSEAAREHVTEMKLMVTGGFVSTQGMIDAIESGDCDVVGVARAITLDRKFAEKAVNGEMVTVRTDITPTIPWPLNWPIVNDGLLNLWYY
eukprot:TRINITY_DN1578_c0_g3_i1.p1 TRINITY_DN1578_c0_g3~~TRINITY_DN1578_c0_g3_i1.p1  ORF type:complete len:179 (+),score=44.67 TRINITY_DN1578_c0_g3_i1:259-795(+)